MKIPWRVSRKTAAIAAGCAAAIGAAAYYIANFTPRTIPVSQDLLGVAYSPDGKTFATGHQFSFYYREGGRRFGQGMGNIRIWPVRDLHHGVSERGTPTIPFLSLPSDKSYRNFSIGGCSDLRYSASSRYLMAGSFVGALGIWDTQAQQWVSRKPARDNGGVFYWPIGFSSDSTLYYYAKIQQISHSPIGSFLQRPQYRTDIVTERVSDGAVTAHVDNCLENTLFPAKFRLLPDGETLACVTRIGSIGDYYSNTGRLILMGLGDGKQKQSWTISEMLDDVYYSPHKNLLVTKSGDGGLLVFTPGSSAPQEIASPLKDHIGRLAFSPDGTRLAGCGEDGDIYLWDTQSWQVQKMLRSYDQWNGVLTFSPDGKTLVTAGARTLRFWRI